MSNNPPVAGIGDLPAADQSAIATTLGALLTGFSEHNADALQDVYADDADWVNAFGTAKKGGKEIVEYLRGLFGDANFDQEGCASEEGAHQVALRQEVPR